MSKKKIITIVSVLAVMLLSASVISYSIANRGNGESNQIDTKLTKRGEGTTSATYTTNIDLIIQNSNKDPKEYFNIVEIIPSSASASNLSTYVTNGGFKNYVIDANSEVNGVMAADSIHYDVIKVSGSTSLDEEISSTIMGGTATLREILDETDLIYMSSPAYNSYEANMSEDVYNYLHTYTLGKNKPMILDYVTENSTSGPGSTQNQKYVDLVKLISNNHIRFNTYAWPQNTGATDFFRSKNGSYYRSFNTDKLTVTGKVLVISSNEKAAGTMYSKMNPAAGGEVTQSTLISYAYYGSNPKPTEWSFDVRTPAGVSTTDLAGDYDFILLENDIMTESISADVYSALKSLSESGKFILYDNRESDSGNTGGNGGGNSSLVYSNNYLKLMEMLVSNKGIARYGHILAVSYGFFTSLNSAGASGLDGAKTIADIINAGDYRGSSTNGANGKVYRVLELQPCYPIDQELAESKPKSGGSNMQYNFGIKGNYYTAPSLVMPGVTQDEVEEGTEYYNFDLSRAKIAYATGLSYNQIQVDQMSTNEFISKKDVVIETYDIVYIGGDTSALVPSDSEILLGNGVSLVDTQRALQVLTSFDMFTHTGQLSLLSIDAPLTDAMKDVAASKGQTLDKPTGQIYINNVKQNTVTEYNGNDINSIKYNELKEYVQKGMPVIVDKRVAEAFEETKALEGSRLKQLALRQIDPDSWMYKTLDTIYTASQNTNVCWGLDTVGTEIVDDAGNADRNYGNTLGASLTVFNETTNSSIKAVKNAGAVRPTLAVTSSPKEYSEGNKNSYNKFKDGFTVEAYAKPGSENGGSKFSISLYIDLDGNGVFSEGPITSDGECAQTVDYTYQPNEDDPMATPATVPLSYTLEENFYGIISWKVVAKDVVTGLVSSVTGYAYYERDEDVEKKEIEILQILPRRASFKKSLEEAIENNTMVQSPMPNQSGGVTLYLCKECQLLRYRANNNIWVNGDGDSDYAVGQVAAGSQTTTNGVTMGLHEHKFGLVKFDSTTQNEDWESNLADVLIKEDGDYTVDVDIMYADEFESLVAQIQGQSEAEIEANKILMADAYSAIEAAETDPAYLAAEEEVKEQLIEMKNCNYNGLKRKSYYEQWAADGEYYKFWLYNSVGNNGGLFYNTQIANFRTAYNTYIEYHDKVVKAKQDYRKYRRLAYKIDQWMATNYSIVVLGWAEDFGGEDLNDDACAMLTDYINRGGSMLNTHDSTTKYDKAGSMNLTEKLRGAFGMDRFHITGVAAGGGGGDAATASEITATIKIDSVEYKKAITGPVQAEYKVIYSIGSDTVDNFYTFTIDANKSKHITYTHNIAWDGNHYHTNDGGQYTVDVQDGADGSDSTITFDATKYVGWYDYEDTSNWNATATVYKRGQGANAWETVWEQVATKTLPRGQGTINIPLATGDLEKAQYTKDFSDNSVVVLKDADREFNVSLVDSNHWDTGKITAGATGTVHTDLGEKMTVTVKVSLPDGFDQVCLDGIDVTLVHNAKVYTATTKNGIATFSIPQVSSLDGNNISSDSLRYRHFVTDDASLYFFTERAVTEDYVQWNKDMSATGFNLPNVVNAWNSRGYNSPVGVTDSYIFYNTGMNGTPYKYVEYISIKSTTWDLKYGTDPNDIYGANGASQLNKGIVTTYPFLISTELRIAQTHPQTYSLDLEDKDVAVWYTLSAGTGRDGTHAGSDKLASSYYAASPYDGMNNYYLYSKGNIFYCGSGHSLVTGPNTDNNDERRLFINIIVNSVRNAGAKPKITVHRKDTEGAEVTEDKNEKLNVDSAGNYYYNVEENDETPEFDFKVIVDSKADLAEVYVFYDLDYGIVDNSNAYKEDNKHVLIAQYNTKATESKTLVSKQLAELRGYKEDVESGEESGYKNLKLKPEYFEVYGGLYTYIVIQATDTNGKTSYQRIKINLIPKLWDLTMTDQFDDSVSIDISNKVKYLI